MQVKAQDLAGALRVDGGGEHAGDVCDPAVLTHLLGEGIEPHVRVGTGIQRVVPKRQLIRDAIGQSKLTVVRLVTPTPLLEARLSDRDVGRRLEDQLAILWRLVRALDQSELEGFRVVNDERSPREVTMEVLEWIGGGSV